MSDKYYTYLILTDTNKLYCGYTNDIEKRFKKHVDGTASKFTRANKPVKLVYYEVHNSKSDAMKAECRIKKLRRPQKEELISTWEKSND